MALAVEACELLEHFQWLTEDQSRELAEAEKEKVASELADVQLYLIRLADELEVDLMKATKKKLALNAVKYPSDLVRGSSKKYTEY